MFLLFRDMTKILTTIFLLISACAFSQTKITAVIKDSGTKESLPYCNVAVSGTRNGTITNGDGVFSISVSSPDDVLVFSYLGYDPKSIPANKLMNTTVIYLTKKNIVISEVTVHSDNDYIYDIFEKCRNNLIKNSVPGVSKVYYCNETSASTIYVELPINGVMTKTYAEDDSVEKPVELLECFYNGYFNGVSIEELGFKNGRTALAAKDNFFLTHNSSKAISMISVTEENVLFPLLPFQMRKGAMKKNFDVAMLSFDGKVYNISFLPKDNNKECFSGEAWIEKGTNNLLKISYRSVNSENYPFTPFHSFDSIWNVSMEITSTFKIESDNLMPDHTNFNYSFNYFSRRDTITGIIKDKWKNMTRKIMSKGLLFFYDYNQPFILPYFEYSDDMGDYKKMSFIPYNEDFWNNNNTILFTEIQKKNFNLLSNDGQLINYGSGNYGNQFLTKLNGWIPRFFEFYYAFWSSDKRIVPNINTPQFETYPPEKINQNIKSNLYILKVQILLDVTSSGDSLLSRSYTVFDNLVSFFHLPIDSNTNAFLNIYFDICEIERRKMQKTLDSPFFSASQIDSIYKVSVENMNSVTSQYIKEVDIGENSKYFEKWNKYVYNILGIDNIKLAAEK